VNKESGLINTSQFVSFKVNGKEVTLPAQPKRTLLRALREELHLTGSKQACDNEGFCGACTVIIDGTARPSCHISLEQIEGCEIETVEGLAQNGELHPLQKTFVLEHVSQCGYATPGQIMSAKALLDRNPNPTKEDASEALRYNISRCSAGYRAPEAITKAAAVLRGDTTLDWDASTAAHERTAISKVTGAIKYTDDLVFPGMLYGRVKRSDFPHAVIEKIDKKAAQQMPGVIAVITAEDVPGQKLYGLLKPDQPVFCDTLVLTVGDALALVVAESFEQAEAALEKISVTYKPLPIVSDPRQSLLPGAHQLHAATEEFKTNGNVNRHVKVRKGDIEEGFKLADFIIEGDYTTPFQEHAYEELECSIGIPEGEGVVVYCGSQGPVFDRAQIASAIGIPENLVRVAHMPVGGGFGGKEDVSAQIQAGLAAYILKRPVKVRFSRAESLSTHHKRHAEFMHYKTGVTKDGRVIALEANIIGDTGAYASTGEAVLFRSATFAGGPYEIPHVKVDAYAVYTNNITCGAFRGFGSPQPCFAAEIQMEKLAHKIGMDPIEFRLKNALTIGNSTITGSVINEEVGDGIRQCIEAVRDSLKKAPSPILKPGEKLGVGIAASYKNVGLGSGIPDNVGAKISLQEDGTFLLRLGATDLGQGSTETFLNIASEILGVPRSNIYLHMGDTRDDPQAGMTTASRITFVAGNAVVIVSEMLLEQIRSYVHNQRQVPLDLIALHDDQVIRKDTHETLITLSQLAQAKGFNSVAHTVYEAPKTQPMPEWASPVPNNTELASNNLHFAYSFGAQGVVLSVNELTGVIKTHRVIAALDCGRALNRPGAEGQIEGGVIQGLGYALSEHFTMKDCRPEVTTLANLGLPLTPDLPEVEAILIEQPHPTGPLGAKGMGELPLSATGPAVANALYDALGVWIHDLPITPEKVLAALHAKKMGTPENLSTRKGN
jgi:CO/xanthine dehydrogenase Mo-binding subunit/aerobic-type carbon monoxide dehydrogenase small subunit (CoxS/CutS family)